MDSKSPLKSLKRYASLLALCYLVVGQTAAVAVNVDTLLEGDSNICFLCLNDQVRPDEFEKSDGVTARYAPSEGRAEAQATPTGLEYTAAVKLFHSIERATVNHGDLNGHAVSGRYRAAVLEGLVNRDAALSVEQASEVDVIEIHAASEQKVRELGEHPMPGLSETDAEGQSRTKQEGSGLPGVRREQVRTPKGKVCSELGGNVENEAETTSSYVVIIPHKVTASYQKTCNVPVRFVRPGGQGGAADPTWEALEYMGRPWYWDRQCPTGRAYFLRNDDTYFMVDPRFTFKWTGDLTYPDQMAFTRLCGLRFFLKTDRRMFQAVIDGVTA